MLEKINRLKNWQAALIIAVIGIAVYASGLTSPFQGDDTTQIVNNVPVHSIANIRLFFEGGTFYNGQGLHPLSGVYFRPLMMTTFSLIYSIFGPHPFYFHLLQMLLGIGSAIILYLFFRFSFKPALALFLALIFLVHPINSQVIYAIPSMQDALFFFFGITALYLLFRYKSVKSLLLVALCLLLSLLSKETGILFIVMSAIYLFWWNRKRLYVFIGIMILPTIFYCILRVHAVGVFNNPNIAPIDSVSLSERLLTAPSIMLFYITKLIFPWRLAGGYYWVYRSFSIRHFLIPLLLDLALIGIVIYAALILHKRASKARYMAFVYFAIWAALGLLLILQITPLDMTACETWFYFSMTGVLGMLGMWLTVFPLRLRPHWLLFAIAVTLVSILGFRTATRGFDWNNQYTLAYKDIASSSEDYNAYNLIAAQLINQGKYKKAEAYAARSVHIYPTYVNYNNLGEALGGQGDYFGALHAYDKGQRLNPNASLIYDNLAELDLVYGKSGNSKALINTYLSAVNKFPGDNTLWMYLAIVEDKYGYNSEAKAAISEAANYGQVPQFVYDSIMNNQPFLITFTNLKAKIIIY